MARTPARTAKTARKRSPIGATIRADNGFELHIPAGSDLQRFAVRWSYLIRNRAHWRTEIGAEMRDLLRQEIRGLGYSTELLKPLGSAALVEVEVPFRTEGENWESRIMPWEFILTRVIPLAPNQPVPLVVRRLRQTRRPAKPKTDAGQPLVMVESAPGALSKYYTFDRERRIVPENLSGPQWKGPTYNIINPSLTELKQNLRQRRPLVVHITGVDNHQGAELLRHLDDQFDDGMYLRAPVASQGAVPVSAAELGQAIGAARPALVGLNLYHSAARIAPLCVAEGAACAVAFQDSIDDALAELFFAEFYRQWGQSGSCRQAFPQALANIMRGDLPLAGSGIVLWSAESLLPHPKTPSRRAGKDQLPLAIDRGPLPQMTPDEVSALPDWKDMLSVEVAVFETINYSLLHNGRSLFKSFYLRNHTDRRIDGIQIRAVLSLGDKDLTQSLTVHLTGAGQKFTKDLPFSLVSSHLRLHRETVVTTLKVSVEWQGHSLYDKNFVVRILPMNEWTDTDDDRHWLPSFVQPRDPAVTRIKDRAKRLLQLIARDRAAGFDGYQQVVHRQRDTWDYATYQVEAIWHALADELPITYTNPPPSYTEGSQRIRTPSEILETGTGTCLDLAVLLAACLEEIDIYPVLFLLKGHAFPGYWQTPKAHEDFWGGWESASHSQPTGPLTSSFRSDDMDQRNSDDRWVLKPTGFHRMLKAIDRGLLVPVESVMVTAAQSLDEAIEVGGENLADRNEFECLLDIVLARSRGVLPLPENR